MNGPQKHVAGDITAFLWGLVWPLLLGAALGAVLVFLLRRRGLRWTWSLLGLPLTYCAWFGPDRRAAVVLGAATVSAIWLGRRVHAEGIALGGEEASHERDALGPFGFLRGRLARLADGRRRPRADTMTIGRGRHGRPRRVPVGGPGHGVHVLVPGATGSGKTVTQASILVAHVSRGQGAVVIDPKDDPGLYEETARAAAAAGARLRTWRPDGSCVYNPLGRGGVDEIADKALAAHEWSEPHYEMAVRRLLGLVLATMRDTGLWPPTLSDLVEHMHPDRLDALADRAGDEELGAAVRAYVDGLDGGARSDLRGGRDRLAVLAESELGRRLDPARGEGEEIDLAAAFERGDVVYFGVAADRYPIAARLLTSALLVDLIGISAVRQRAPRGGVVLIDEFGAVAADLVSRLFARSRGAGISMILGTQTLADLRAVGEGTDVLTEQVISNVAYTVAHRIPDPDSAERLARMAGTQPAWAVTQQVEGHALLPSGQGTRTRQRDFRVPPDRFKSLRTGEAVLIHPTAPRPAEVIRVTPARRGER
jgi:hypothetical protein